MIMCVLLCYPISIHMSQLLSTGRPISSYPTALKGCWGIVFTHGVRMGGRAGVRAGGRREKSLSGLYLRNRKV